MPSVDSAQQQTENTVILSFKKISDRTYVTKGIVPYTNDTFAIVVKKNADIKKIIPAVLKLAMQNSPTEKTNKSLNDFFIG